MNNLAKPLPIAIGIAFCAVVIALIAIGIGGDIYDLNHGLWWISFAKQIQWESILAGVLGLAGGIFVLTASRAQIAAIEKSTDETLRQSKIHHADARTSVLRLAMDMSTDNHEWAKTRINILEHHQNETTEGVYSSEKSAAWGKALFNVNQELLVRCLYAGDMLKAHGVTSFNYPIHTAISLLCNAVSIDADVMLPANPRIPNEHHTVTMKRLREVSDRSAQAKTYIDFEISRVCRECGLE
ncbi:hypothetical protein MACH10_19980 [Thalassospira tepidiphila]|uniref:hypothetical protein n=1 Tax=Thalassospira tepidiphila TaxID=393657 RepID=UPI002924241E|nr:hypothetical protein MACH10_19980 [Thalassospira tepidiphila]